MKTNIKRQFTPFLYALLALSALIAACAPASTSSSEAQVATIVAGTLAAMPTEAPSSLKLEDFPNKVFIGENERFSVFVLNSSDPSNFEQTGPILIYNKGAETVYEIAGSFTLLTSTPIFNDDAGNYVALSPGTYIIHKAIIISLADKRQAVNDLCVNGGGNLFWGDYYIYTNCDTFPNRPWGSGEAPSIMAVNLKTGAETVLAKSDLLRHFSIKGITGNTLQYLETSVTSEADWGSPNVHISTELTYDLTALK